MLEHFIGRGAVEDAGERIRDQKITAKAPNGMSTIIANVRRRWPTRR